MEGPNDSAKLDDDVGITMVDVLQEEEELEEDAEAVLGSGDDTNCTYNQGYLTRQPLYACLTCCPASSDQHAGFCLACSYHCHENHELVELYTKRNFRCDCGNSKFPEKNPCKLLKDKEPLNAENKYSQNFQGMYCTCSRPYPDPEDTIDDQMIQCIICEDWYHGRHLEGAAVPPEDNFSEMICHLCMPKVHFMKYYTGYSVLTKVSSEDSKENLDISSSSPTKETEASPISSTPPKTNGHENTPEVCRLKDMKEDDDLSAARALFLLDKWRDQLCHCSSCKKTYSDLGLSFLLNCEDTVAHYEQEGRAKRRDRRGLQREIDALSSIDRVTRTEMVHEFNNLSSSLREYLKKFAENGKTVRGEDITEFFSQLSAKKKQKTNAGIPHFCK